MKKEVVLSGSSQLVGRSVHDVYLDFHGRGYLIESNRKWSEFYQKGDKVILSEIILGGFSVRHPDAEKPDVE